MDKDNIMMIEFEKSFFGTPMIEMVALYNKSKISEEEVRRVIKEESYHKDVIVVEKRQYVNVFMKGEC